jgi:hypothetical protein
LAHHDVEDNHQVDVLLVKVASIEWALRVYYRGVVLEFWVLVVQGVPEELLCVVPVCALPARAVLRLLALQEPVF